MVRVTVAIRIRLRFVAAWCCACRDDIVDIDDLSIFENHCLGLAGEHIGVFHFIKNRTHCFIGVADAVA